MAQHAKAKAAGITIKPAGKAYVPSDVRERRDMIKNFLANEKLLEGCNDKLMKVLSGDQTGFSADEARRFVLDFLLPEIDRDRDEKVASKEQRKERPAGAGIDKTGDYWKPEIENSLKDSALKPTKNTRE